MTNVEKAKSDAAAAPKPVSIQELIQKSAKEFGRALPKHMNADRLLRIALTTLKLNPALYQCDPMSFIACLFMSAQLGLEPNVNGEAWIIPYNTKSGRVAQFQVGYMGWIKLFYNHQAAVTIQMETIHKNDHFSCDLGANELSHKLPPFGEDRGATVGYYAIGTMKSGGKTFKVMSKEEMLKFAKKFSKCYDDKFGDFYSGTPWREHFDAMGMKTVLKQLIKQLPKSVEIQRALAMDETVKTKIDFDMADIPDETDHKTDSKELIAPEASGKKTALEVKIHTLKADLIKASPEKSLGAQKGEGEIFYYSELGKLGAEHMAELSDLNKEVFKNILQDKLKTKETQ